MINPYLQNQIMSAKPEKLVVMCYDGIIKYCNMAILDLEKKNFIQKNIDAQKGEKIVDYLISMLDERYETYKDFERIYKYILKNILDGNMKNEKEKFLEAIEQTKIIKNTWNEVCSK